MLKAVIFDCDGVISDNERNGHRPAFNRAFADKGIDAEWDIDLYRRLLKVTGGKERMRHFFSTTGWPTGFDDHDALVDELHRIKTVHYMNIIESGGMPLRPGILGLVDDAIADGVMLAICSTSNERAVHAIIDRMMGPERKKHFAAILAGDVVSRKKPDPAIYNLAVERLGIERNECVVLEDSSNGLRSAKAAGLHCVITTTEHTEREDFTGADIVVPELGTPPNVTLSYAMIREMAKLW